MCSIFSTWLGVVVGVAQTEPKQLFVTDWGWVFSLYVTSGICFIFIFEEDDPLEITCKSWSYKDKLNIISLFVITKILSTK